MDGVGYAVTYLSAGRPHACVYLGTWISCAPAAGTTTARSFLPVSSSVSILADLLFICLFIYFCDALLYHPSEAVSDNTTCLRRLSQEGR